MTALVLLSDASDFGGATLQHDLGGPVREAPLAKGDMAVYRSHQRHRVTRLTSGRRLALAIEFWHVPSVDHAGHWAHARPSWGDGTCPR